MGTDESRVEDEASATSMEECHASATPQEERQEDLSSLLFNWVMDRILREATEKLGRGLHIEYTSAGGLFLLYRDKTPASTCIQNVLYADDLTLIAETRRELQHMLDVLGRACA